MGIWGFLDVCFTAYLGSVVNAYVPYAHLMVFLGFAAVATVEGVPKVIDGLNLQKTNKVLAYLGPGYMNYLANVSSTILMYAHFVMGDPQTSFFVLVIINVRPFVFWLRDIFSNRPCVSTVPWAKLRRRSLPYCSRATVLLPKLCGLR